MFFFKRSTYPPLPIRKLHIKSGIFTATLLYFLSYSRSVGSYLLIAIQHALPGTKRRHLSKGCWLAINPLSSVFLLETRHSFSIMATICGVATIRCLKWMPTNTITSCKLMTLSMYILDALCSKVDERVCVDVSKHALQEWRGNIWKH